MSDETALFYCTAPGAELDPAEQERRWGQIWERFGDFCLKAGNRGAVAGEFPDALAAVAGVTPGDTDGSPELRMLSAEAPDPFPGSGWPVLVVQDSPRIAVQVIEDRRVSAVIYVARSDAELRHFQVAYPGSASV